MAKKKGYFVSDQKKEQKAKGPNLKSPGKKKSGANKGVEKPEYKLRATDGRVDRGGGGIY